MTGPLEGVRVLELAQGLSGPYAGMLLGDAGARVIKVEPPTGDYARAYGPPRVGTESAQFLEINRNKRGIVLDLEQAEARPVLERLIREADVVVTDLGPTRAAALGLDYASIERINRRAVHCNITPFGERGPMADQPGSELVIQAMAEFHGSLGAIDEAPLRLGTDVANINTGQQAVHGIVAALLMRDRIGEGQFVEVNMLRTLMHMRGMAWTIMSEQADAFGGPHRPNHIIPNGANAMHFKPAEHGVRTKDGYVLLQGRGSTPEAYQELLTTLGIYDEVKDDPRWGRNGGDVLGPSSAYGWQVKDTWERALADRTTEETVEFFESRGLSAFPVNTYETLFADPQVHEIRMVQELTHPTAGTYRTLGSPWLFEDTPAGIQGPAPLLGQHTDEVLGEIGMAGAEVARLRAAGIVG